ncbi:hypothetical protein AB0H83_01750 [Dactylosporangium sp. NPDC050688]|uniref:hypothetical protein n=1 Tax=Dactylosporangium sp. NPDC050688 TaxID=3157217 RepID=UPI0033EB39A3
MRLLYKAVAVGTAGAAGMTPLTTAAQAAPAAQELRVDGCGTSWGGTLELCAAGETSHPGTGPAGYGPADTNDWRYGGVGTGGPLHPGLAGGGYGTGTGNGTPGGNGGTTPGGGAGNGTPGGNGGTTPGGGTGNGTPGDTPGGGAGNGTPGGGGAAPGTTPSGTGTGTGGPGVAAVPVGSWAGPATGTAAGALPVTGTSSMMTTIGFGFIIGGAGILYLTRLGDRGEEQGRGPARKGPGPRDGRPATPQPRRRPSPQATRRS